MGLLILPGSSAFDWAWRQLFRGVGDSRQLDSLRKLFPMNSDVMDSYGFSSLHKAILRLDCYTFEEEIKAHRSEIDGADKDGNTALKWAAGRGDSQAVNLLLKAGANANSQNHYGSSALHEAARVSDLQGLQFLLEAGADPHQIESWGQAALHFVRGADAGNIVQCLVKAGAKVDARDLGGVSPLQLFAGRCDVKATETILNLGVDINSLDHDGDSALLVSISAGADDTTELLLSRGAKYTTWWSSGCSLLHLAALFGGLRTLDILLDAKLHDIDPDALSRQGQTALQNAQARASKPEGFVEKLQELLTDIRVRNANLQGPTDLDEHGNMANKTERPCFMQPTYHAKRSRHRDIIPRLVQVSLLLALICIGSRYLCWVRGLDQIAQSLARAWSMIGPDDFIEP